MSALELIDLLQDKDLISERSVEKLRRQVQDSPKTITAGALAKLLVKKDLLTEPLARKLLKQLEQRRAKPHLSDDLQLLPDEDLQPEAELIDVDEPVPGDEELTTLPDEDAAPPAPSSDEPEEFAEVYEEADGETSLGEPESMDDLLSDGGGEDGAATVTVGKRKRGLAAMLGLSGGKRKKFTANRWDSPLILVGGGALLILVFAAVGLWFYLSRGTGDDAFSLAYEDYRQQSYNQSIGKFEKFISDYPDHPKVSLAKVRIGLAKIWSEVDRSRWDDALQTSRTELGKIENEEAFSEARLELASILPDIMDGFADQALKAEDVAGAQAYLDQANVAYEDVNNAAYLPTSVRQGQQQRIEQILGKLEAVEHRINQDNELTQTVADIQAAAERGEIAQAYDLRKSLLTKYPSLEADSRLSEVIFTVTQKERESVGPISDPPTSVTDDHQPLSQFQVTLASRRGGKAQGVEGRVVFAFVYGAVYGLNAESGDVLWRRFVGLNSPHLPLALSSNVGADVLVVDATRQELLRLKADSGELVWRLSCGQPLASPVLANGRLFVGMGDDRTGKLFELDPDTGGVIGGANFETGLATGPGLDADRNVLAQVGSHSSVYMLGLDDWSCNGVHYLGHAEGTVDVPPVVIQEHVIVAENPGPDFSLIHVLAPDTDGERSLKSLVDPIRLQGRVVVDMVPFGRRVLVSTDRGKIHVFELDPDNSAEPVRQIANVSSAVRPGTVGYPLLGQGRLWVGDSQLSKYELQTSRGQLVRKWINGKGDAFLAPLQRFGDVLFVVRKKANRMGATVSAMTIDERDGGARDGEMVWETDLGVPSAGEPFVNRAAQAIDVVTGNGAQFAIDTAAIRAGVVDQPQSEVIDNRLGTLTQSVTLAKNQFAFFSDPIRPQMALFNPANSNELLSVVTLDSQGAGPATLPTSYQEGLLVSTRDGPIYLVDVQSGQSLVHPYLPPLKANANVDWLPATVTEDGSQAILCDATGRMYQLSVDVGEKSQLTSPVQAKVEKKMIARLAALESQVFGASRGVGADTVVSFNTTDLQPVHEWNLKGRVTWGPVRIGDGVLVASDADELVKVVETEEVAWRSELSYGQLAGTPLLVGDDLILASVSGIIWKLDGQTGEEINRIDVGEPLGTGVVQFSGSRLLVCGGDGTVHVVNFPE